MLLFLEVWLCFDRCGGKFTYFLWRGFICILEPPSLYVLDLDAVIYRVLACFSGSSLCLCVCVCYVLVSFYIVCCGVVLL